MSSFFLLSFFLLDFALGRRRSRRHPIEHIRKREHVNDVIELDELRVARIFAEQKAPSDWRAFVTAVARDVVEHLPDVVVWKTAPSLLNVAATTLSAAALSGGLAVQRIDGALCLMVRQCEDVLIELLSVRLAVPRPLVTVPV